MKRIKIQLGYDLTVEFDNEFELTKLIENNNEEELKTLLIRIHQAKCKLVKVYKIISFNKTPLPIIKKDKMYCPYGIENKKKDLLLNKVSQKTDKKYFYCPNYECEYFIFENDVKAMLREIEESKPNVGEINW